MIKIVPPVFFIILFTYSSLAFQLTQEAVDITQNLAIVNTNENLNRVTADVRALTITVGELSAAVNRFIGIGIAVGAIGGLIVILQSLQVVQKEYQVRKKSENG